MILCATVVTDFARYRGLRAIGGIGAFSYSIYLWHLPLFKVVFPWLSDSTTFGLAAWTWPFTYTGAAVIVGVIMAKLVEVPSLALRDRFFPSADNPVLNDSEADYAHAVPSHAKP